MVKSVIKEFIILILLLTAIVLLFALILYDYNPTNKTIPEHVAAYTLPDEVKTELESSLSGEERIVKTYQIDGADLNRYQKMDEYNPGRVKPYALYNSTLNELQVVENTMENNVEGNVVEESPSSNGIFFNTPGK